MARISPSYFLLAALASATFLSPSLGQAADPAPELSFHSTKGWALEKDGKSCALQTTFNNGFVLRFQGGTSWVETLNIDFAQDAFSVDKSYDIKLSVPGVETLKTKSTPANARALDVSFRGRKDFFKALAKASVLDVQIEKNNFRFYMTGFSKPANEFEQCMGGKALADPAIAEQTKNYAVNEAIAMEESVKQSKEVAATKVETPASPAPVAQAPTKDVPVPVADKNANANAAPVNAAPGLVPKNAVMSPDKIAAMVAAQTEGKTSAPSPAADSVVPVETNSVRNEEAVEFEPPVAPIKPHEDIVETAENIQPAPAVPPVKEPARAPERYSSPEIKVTKKSMRTEVDFTNEGLSPAEQKLSTADKARLAELEDMVEKLKRENIALNDEVKASVSASEEERLSISSENWNLEQATMRFNEAERQNKRLGQELQQERAKCEADKKDLEASLFDPQITDQEQLARLARLEQELAAVKEENARLRQGQPRTQ